MESKICNRCNVDQPLDNFHKSKSGKYGRDAKCKPCDLAHRKSSPEKVQNSKSRSRRWYLKNRERLLEANRGNPDRLQYLKNYYWSNPDRHRKVGRDNWNRLSESEKENRRTKHRNWKLENLDHIRAYDLLHKEEKLEHGRRRRAKKFAVTIVSISTEQLRLRMSVFGNKCAYCEGPFEHIDHVIPLSRGGLHALCNLRPACKKCNLTKSAKPAKEWLASLKAA